MVEDDLVSRLVRSEEARKVIDPKAARLNDAIEEARSLRKRLKELDEGFPKMRKEALESIFASLGIGVCYNQRDHFLNGVEGTAEAVGIFPLTQLKIIYREEGGRKQLIWLCKEHADQIYNGRNPKTSVCMLHTYEKDGKLHAVHDADISNVSQASPVAVWNVELIYGYLGLPCFDAFS